MILAFLFIFFGCIAIFYQRGITLLIEESYTAEDLLVGWGIYAITIGLLLKFPKSSNVILTMCFAESILWHYLIAQRRGWTKHHKDSIFINVLSLGLVTV